MRMSYLNLIFGPDSFFPSNKDINAKSENTNHCTTLNTLLACRPLSNLYLYPWHFAYPCKNYFFNS